VYNVSFSFVTTDFKTGEHLIFRFKFTNSSGGPLTFGHVGPVVYNSDGAEIWDQWSWTNWTTAAGATEQWEDWFGLYVPGTYTVKFTICFSSVAACDNGTGERKVLAPPITITVH
jgi:hypothetical protein